MIDLIKDRLEEYGTQDPVQKQYAVKEILQEIALFSLWKTGFFEYAAFQGGYQPANFVWNAQVL